MLKTASSVEVGRLLVFLPFRELSERTVKGARGVADNVQTAAGGPRSETQNPLSVLVPVPLYVLIAPFREAPSPAGLACFPPCQRRASWVASSMLINAKYSHPRKGRPDGAMGTSVCWRACHWHTSLVKPPPSFPNRDSSWRISGGITCMAMAMGSREEMSKFRCSLHLAQLVCRHAEDVRTGGHYAR
jgi:hypothetical protein